MGQTSLPLASVSPTPLTISDSSEGEPHCCHQWSECYCPDAGFHFSGLSQLTPYLIYFQTRDDYACTLILFWHNAQMLLAKSPLTRSGLIV